MEFKAVFATPDGKIFDTKQEAINHIRRPKIKEAMLKVTQHNVELTDWMIDNQEAVEVAFEAGTIRRVTKVEYKNLEKTLNAIKEANNPKFGFVTDNAAAILESFRWPSVKRMTEEEKLTAARNSLIAASEGNEELATWIISNKDAVLEAYGAGVEKREINPKAAEALAAYRAKKAAEKAAAEAAKAG